MKDLIELIKTIQDSSCGWIVLIMAIVALATIIIVALVTFKQSAKSLGEIISDSVNNSVNQKSEVRLKELKVRQEELEIQKTLITASAESVSTLNDLINNTVGINEAKATKVKVTKVTHCQSRDEEFKMIKKKTRKPSNTADPKHCGGFSRR